MQKKFVKKLSIALGAICVATSPTMNVFAMEGYVPEHRLIPLTDSVPDFSITEIDFTNGVFGFMYNKANTQRRRLESFSVYSYDESSGVDLMTVEDTIKEQSFGKRYFYASRTLGTMPQETPITDDLVLMKGTMFSNFWNENLGKKLAILVRFNDDSHWVSRISYGDCAWSYGLTCMPKIYWGLAEYGVYYQAYEVSEKLPQPDPSLEPEPGLGLESGSESELEPGSGPDLDLDSDPDPDLDLDLDPDLDLDSEPDLEPEPEPELEPELEPESGAGLGDELEQDNELEPGSELKPGNNVGSDLNTGTGTEEQQGSESGKQQELDSGANAKDKNDVGTANAVNNIVGTTNNSIATDTNTNASIIGTSISAGVNANTRDDNIEGGTDGAMDASNKDDANYENVGVDVEVPKLGGSERESKDGLSWIWGISGFSAGVLITWFLFTVNKKKERRR